MALHARRLVAGCKPEQIEADTTSAWKVVCRERVAGTGRSADSGIAKSRSCDREPPRNRPRTARRAQRAHAIQSGIVVPRVGTGTRSATLHVEPERAGVSVHVDSNFGVEVPSGAG